MDAAADRIEQATEAGFRTAVNANRLGYVIARDRKAARSWDRRVARAQGGSVGLTGAALESAIGAFASTHPEYIVHGAA